MLGGGPRGDRKKMRIWAQALAAETEGGGRLQGLFNVPAGALSRGSGGYAQLSRLGT